MKLFEKVLHARAWTEEEQQILDQVQRMVDDVIAPNAARIDRTGDFPWENVTAINELGLNTIFVPEAHGGMPMSYVLYLEIVSIISEACASTGIIYATTFHGMKPLIDFGNDEQRGRLLPRIAAGGLGALAITEPTAGSDATGMKTSFRPDGDEIVIKGSKTFISNGDVADLYLLFGKWTEIENPKAAISVLILEKDTPGFSVISKEHKMGHNGSSTCALAFDDARVPRANLIGKPGGGLAILLASLNKSRPSVAAHARGIARAAFKDMVSYANARSQGGRTVLDFQGNQFTLADLACELLMLERWMDYVAALIAGGDTDFGMEASIAKLRASDLAMKMALECVQFHGGYGYCQDYRAERLMRDAKITQIWEGTNQIHRQLIWKKFSDQMTEIRKVAICGAGGTMGAGIALVVARAGFETVCFDKSADGLARSRKTAAGFLHKSVERGRMTQDACDATLARMHDTTDLTSLSDCDLVIEAIFENLAVKQALLAELNGICKPATIFASNTSTLSITQIAGVCGREDRVVGMHFCLPAQLMKLIEVSRGINTSDATFFAAWAWTEGCGQLPVETQDKPGFILNALLVPFNNDVIRAIEAGLATPEDIDTAIRTGLGYKMGPCALIDLIGLDTQILLGEAFYPITLDRRASVPPLLRRMVAAGRLGNKSEQGFLTSRKSERARVAPPYRIVARGESRSFPAGDAFLSGAAVDADVTMHLAGGFQTDPTRTAVLVELDTECLGVHTGEDMGREGSNTVGFARYRNGDDAPSQLIELVRQPGTSTEAIGAARAIFEVAGFEVVVCADQPGRIVDRLARPKYNDALRFLDEGLATAEDMDKTCRLGLGYPDGLIERVTRGGLARHFDIATALHGMTGHSGYAPARRAVVAKERYLHEQGLSG